MFWLLRSNFKQIKYECNISVAKACKKSAQEILNIYIQFVFVFVQITLGESLAWKQSASNFTHQKRSYNAEIGERATTGLSTPLKNPLIYITISCLFSLPH